MTADRVVRVALADRQRSLIEAIALRLDAEDDIQVVGVATVERELVSVCERGIPDVVVLGVEDLAPLGGAFRWLGLVSGLDAARCVRLLRRGASGAGSKEAPVAELVAGVRATGSGELWVPPRLVASVLGLLLQGEQEPTPEGEALARLSVREREVLDCLARGMDQRGMAEELYLSPNTVRTHVRNILVKLGVRSSLEATALARRAAGGRPEK